MKSSTNSIQNKEQEKLKKYVFYFERFSNNDKSCINAQNLMKKMENFIKDFHKKVNMDFGEVVFLIEAAEVLSKCRRILKWTYCYSYYITDEKKKGLFEFNQKDLEKYCEELHELLEMKFATAIKEKDGVLDLKLFMNYKSEVICSYTKAEKVFKFIKV